MRRLPALATDWTSFLCENRVSAPTFYSSLHQMPFSKFSMQLIGRLKMQEWKMRESRLWNANPIQRAARAYIVVQHGVNRVFLLMLLLLCYYYNLLVKAYHRLNCSSSTVLTATCLSYESLAWLSDFFRSWLWRPQPTFTQNDGCTQGCAFCRNKRYFSYSLNSRPYSFTSRCFHSRIFNVPQLMWTAFCQKKKWKWHQSPCSGFEQLCLE